MLAAPVSSNLSLQGDYDIYGKKVKGETLSPLQSGIRSVKEYHG